MSEYDNYTDQEKSWADGIQAHYYCIINHHPPKLWEIELIIQDAAEMMEIIPPTSPVYPDCIELFEFATKCRNELTGFNNPIGSKA